MIAFVCLCFFLSSARFFLLFHSIRYIKQQPFNVLVKHEQTHRWVLEIDIVNKKAKKFFERGFSTLKLILPCVWLHNFFSFDSYCSSILPFNFFLLLLKAYPKQRKRRRSSKEKKIAIHIFQFSSSHRSDDTYKEYDEQHSFSPSVDLYFFPATT